MADLTSPERINRTIMLSSAWVVGMRWTMRVIGLVSTFFLARLLTPEDFGLVAMATLSLGLIEVFTQTGQLLALIRHPNPSRAHFDTVWTVSILIGVAVTLILWGVAPLAAAFFSEARAETVIRILALRALIGGFENVGVVKFRRDLEFNKDFYYQIAQRFLTFFITLGLAIWLRNYWALVIGILASRGVTVIGSFLIVPYRPRFDLSKVPEIWSFSTWILISHVAQFFQEKTDELVVGHVTDTTTMGTYNVAADAATAPTAEVITPLSRALFPIYAKLADNPAAVAEAFLNVYGMVVLMAASVAVGISLVAEDFVRVTLGEQWARAAPLVEWLALGGAFYALMQPVFTVASATGHARTSALMAISRMSALVLAVVLVAGSGSAMLIAEMRTGVMALLVPGMLVTLGRIIPVTLRQVAARSWRPMTAAVLMAAAVKAGHPLMPDIAVARLLLEAGLGATIFSGALGALWLLSGRPAGSEQEIAGVIHRLLTGWRGKARAADHTDDKGRG